MTRLTLLEGCLETVEQCDIFLGLILPRYGSGIEDKGGDSITHKENVEAIALYKPRWFLVHEHVAVARQLLAPYRKKDKQGKDLCPFEFDKGLEFQKTSILSDLRVIGMFELVMMVMWLAFLMLIMMLVNFTPLSPITFHRSPGVCRPT